MKDMTKSERNWILYDWANSAYATIMVAAVFPIYFVNTAAAAGISGDVWWGFGTSASTLAVAFLAPILGAVADFRGMKKRMFIIFLILGLTATLFSAAVSSWSLLLAGYILSNIGWAASLLFYDAFLTDVTTRDRMDRISAWGYGMGYIGGSTIPFLLAILLIMYGELIGIDSVSAVRVSLVITVLWWGGFSIPFLKNVRQLHYIERPSAHLVRTAFGNIRHTFSEILKNRTIRVFMLAYFFYIDGVNTVIHMATSYGAALGLDGGGMILALLVTQLVAFPFAILFARLAKHVGSIRVILAAIGVYVCICLIGFGMGYGIEENLLTRQQALMIFWLLAILVGTCQGGIQALSRSFFGKLIPPERSNEYFGFFDIFGKFAAIIGPGLYAAIAAATGRSSFAMASIILLFSIGGLILFACRHHLTGQTPPSQPSLPIS